MGKKFEEFRNEMSPDAQKEVEGKVKAATNNMDKPPKTILENWRVLYSAGTPFLAALDVSGHPFIAHGPIITSPIVCGEPKQGETVVTKSGTNYLLGTELPKDDDCEFARPYLIERVSRNLAKAGQYLKLQQLDELNALIDRVLAGERL
ncbi:MAG: hypothetical protein Q7J24_03595 [Desulfomicrobium sp.]|nr:hypothetical protein [Desulfomicrobium sp.]